MLSGSAKQRTGYIEEMHFTSLCNKPWRETKASQRLKRFKDAVFTGFLSMLCSLSRLLLSLHVQRHDSQTNVIQVD